MELPTWVSKIANPYGPHFDKVLHFAAGTIAGVAALIFAGSAFYDGHIGTRGLSLAPFLVALAAGLGKEAFDAYSNRKATGNWRGDPIGVPHGVDALDVVATALPGAILSLITYAVLYVVSGGAAK